MPSIHPLYHVEDLILDDRLLGAWGNNDEGEEAWDNGEVWKFETLPKKKGFLGIESSEDPKPGYLLTITQEKVPAKFEVRLLELNDHLYIDMYPWSEFGYTYGEVDGIKNDWLQMHLFPVHTFARIRFEKGKLIIEPFNPDFIVNLLEQKRIRISHEETKDNFVLTAGTDELQKFVLKFGNEKEAYIEPGVFSSL